MGKAWGGEKEQDTVPSIGDVLCGRVSGVTRLFFQPRDPGEGVA